MRRTVGTRRRGHLADEVRPERLDLADRRLEVARRGPGDLAADGRHARLLGALADRDDAAPGHRPSLDLEGAPVARATAAGPPARARRAPRAPRPSTAAASRGREAADQALERVVADEAARGRERGDRVAERGQRPRRAPPCAPRRPSAASPARSAAEAIDRERAPRRPAPSGSTGAGRPPTAAWAAAVRRARRRVAARAEDPRDGAGEQRQQGDRAGDGRPGGARPSRRPGARRRAQHDARARGRSRAASTAPSRSVQPSAPGGRERAGRAGVARDPDRVRPGRSARAPARPGRPAARSRPWPPGPPGRAAGRAGVDRARRRGRPAARAGSPVRRPRGGCRARGRGRRPGRARPPWPRTSRSRPATGRRGRVSWIMCGRASPRAGESPSAGTPLGRAVHARSQARTPGVETRWLTTSTTSRRRGARGAPSAGARSLTASEAAALIGVSVATVRGWADDGRLPSYRTEGGHRRFELDELRAWLTRRGAPAPEPPPLHARPAGRARLPPPGTRAERAAPSRSSRARSPGTTTRSRPRCPRRASRRCDGWRSASSGCSRPGSRPAGPRCRPGRAELAGLRGGPPGQLRRARDRGAHPRRPGHRDGGRGRSSGTASDVEPLAIPALFAVIDHAQAAVARGFEQAQGLRPGRALGACPSSSRASRAAAHRPGCSGGFAGRAARDRHRRRPSAGPHPPSTRGDLRRARRDPPPGHAASERPTSAWPTPCHEAQPSERRQPARSRSRGASGDRRPSGCVAGRISTRIRRTAARPRARTTGGRRRRAWTTPASMPMRALEHGNAERRGSRPRKVHAHEVPAAPPTPRTAAIRSRAPPGRCRPPSTARSRARARPRAPRRPPRRRRGRRGDSSAVRAAWVEVHRGGAGPAAVPPRRRARSRAPTPGPRGGRPGVGCVAS